MLELFNSENFWCRFSLKKANVMIKNRVIVKPSMQHGSAVVPQVFLQGVGI